MVDSLVTMPTLDEGTQAGPQFPRHVYVISLALAFVGAVAAALTFFIPDVLSGPAVTNGNARGTVLVMLALATPLLLLSMWLTARGTWRAIFVWFGSLFYIFYNSFLLLFLTPFNRLFLLYVATMSLAIFAILSLGRATDVSQLGDRAKPLPMRGLAVYVWTVVAINTFLWLQPVVEAISSDDPSAMMEGTGVATNPIYVQDLAFWLPLMALAAWWLWQGKPLGILLTGSWLVFGVMESVGIAVDQWFGHHADPTSPLASDTVSIGFLVFAAIGMIPVYFYLRPRRESPAAQSSQG
jgi:hypothetical protein